MDARATDLQAAQRAVQDAAEELERLQQPAPNPPATDRPDRSKEQFIERMQEILDRLAGSCPPDALREVTDALATSARDCWQFASEGGQATPAAPANAPQPPAGHGRGDAVGDPLPAGVAASATPVQEQAIPFTVPDTPEVPDVVCHERDGSAERRRHSERERTRAAAAADSPVLQHKRSLALQP